MAALGLVFSAFLANHQAASVQDAGHARFVQEARAFGDVLLLRMHAHTELLQGVRSLFSVRDDLSPADFDQVLRDLQVSERHPEVQALAFVQPVPAGHHVPDDLPVVPAQVPAQVPTQAHASKPQGTDFVVSQWWPQQGNEYRLGMGVEAHPMLHTALLSGQKHGTAVVTPPFDSPLASEIGVSVLVGMPVRRLRAAQAPMQDGALHTGTVVSVLSVSNLVQSMVQEGLADRMLLMVEDYGDAKAPAGTARTLRPLFQSSAVPAGTRQSGPLRVLVRDLSIYDRRWRLEFRPAYNYLSPSEARMPWLVGWGGALVSLLLGVTVWQLARRRSYAMLHVRASDIARRESEARFSTLFNQAVVGVAQLDMASGRVGRVNQRWCDILGYPDHALESMELSALVHPDDIERLAPLTSGESTEFRVELRCRHASGRDVWIDLTVSPMWAAEGSGALSIAVVQDISQRMQMECTLRSSKQRLHDILQYLPVGVCLMHGDGRMGFRNSAFEQMCGYTEQETPTADDWWLAVCPDPVILEQARQMWRHSLEKACQGSVTASASEYSIQCKDGHKRSVEIAVVNVNGDYLLTMVDLTQRKSAEEEIRYLAFFDPLTGLPNRRLLLDRLQHALTVSERQRRSGAVLLLGLDHFKTVNESQGHDTGDQLLRAVALRLRSFVHEDDTVARPGGDEFVVMLGDVGASPHEAAARTEETAQRILTMLREPYLLDGVMQHTSLSMGIAIFNGAHETAEDLLNHADLAMYQVKAEGRDNLRFYDPQMQASMNERTAMVQDMRLALQQNQFELYYQPQVERGRIVGAEALLRWHHPRDGFISPALFIPLAEEAALILPLGEWVLQQACQRLALWAQDSGLADLTLAINVSPLQFHQGAFVEQVLAALAGSGAEGPRLKLELTESLLLEDIEDTIAKMAQLKGYGVGFSLDDFGTGYSSLSYLKRLPLDQLKIDQSFVRDVLTDPNDAAIARTVVALGTSLGLRVIAEGVETEAQREFLERNHCHTWQGYLYSPPVPVQAFEAMVRSRNAA